MTVGAPPDEFFGDGQDWGFSRRSCPVPVGAAAPAVAPARRVRRTARLDPARRPRHGRAAAVVDPEGMGAQHGAYVRYPREELLAVVAAEATRTAKTIIGENLGTVPDEVTDALAAGAVLGMYEEQFALYHRDALPPIPPTASPASAPTTCRRSPPPSTATPTASVDEYRRLVAEPSATRSATSRPTCSTPRSSGSPRATPTHRGRRRRPRRRDRPAQRARAGAAVDVAARLPRPLGGARRPRRPPARQAPQTRTADRKGASVTSANPVGEIDLHLFNEGTHRHLHHCLGAHTDDTGTWFAVWAPNAASSTCSATSTAGAGSASSRSAASGIWSGHVRGHSAGQSYRYAVTTHDGERWRSPTRSARRPTSRRRRRR
jgi:hypothetical protein